MTATTVSFQHDRLDARTIGPCVVHGRRVHVIGRVRWGGLVTLYHVRDEAGVTSYADAADVAPLAPPLLRLWRWLTGSAA